MEKTQINPMKLKENCNVGKPLPVIFPDIINEHYLEIKTKKNGSRKKD